MRYGSDDLCAPPTRNIHPTAPNLLQRDFTASAPNRVWATDITYLWTTEGWLYLAVMLDLYSRRVVGWAMSERIDEELVLSTLQMALLRRRPPRGLIHHSDRGSQYCGSPIPGCPSKRTESSAA